MKIIMLTQGYTTMVDDDLFEHSSKWKWQANVNKRTGLVYAYRGHKMGHVLYMHRHIMDAPKGMVVDHINHDTLDNRKCNLRVCTQQVNVNNTLRVTSSKYKGVTLTRKYWKAQVYTRVKVVYVGCFKDEKDAARAYNAKAVELLGDKAILNAI